MSHVNYLHLIILRWNLSSIDWIFKNVFIYLFVYLCVHRSIHYLFVCMCLFILFIYLFLFIFIFHTVRRADSYRFYLKKQLPLIFNSVYLGVAPKDSSILMNALMLHHYKRGAYYPKGGASEIPYHIIRTIQKHGGNCLVRAPVTQILVNQKGAAYGRAPPPAPPPADNIKHLQGAMDEKKPLLFRGQGEERSGGGGGSRACGHLQLWHLQHAPEAPPPRDQNQYR